MAHGTDERSPLLEHGYSHDEEPEVSRPIDLPRSNELHAHTYAIQLVDFEKEDKEDPKNWTRGRKLLNVAIIALMASPLC